MRAAKMVPRQEPDNCPRLSPPAPLTLEHAGALAALRNLRSQLDGCPHCPLQNDCPLLQDFTRAARITIAQAAVEQGIGI